MMHSLLHAHAATYGNDTMLSRNPSVLLLQLLIESETLRRHYPCVRITVSQPTPLSLCPPDCLFVCTTVSLSSLLYHFVGGGEVTASFSSLMTKHVSPRGSKRVVNETYR